MPRVRVVLVRPENPTNIGAVARVVRNMGLSGLDLVGPGDWRTLPCWRTAWRAQDLLEQAGVFSQLAEALGGAHFCAAFSGRTGAQGTVLDVRAMAEEVVRLPEDESASLVFGPERSGLAEAELAHCGRRVLIPSHPDQPSLNLSHAVMVAAYEVFRAFSSRARGVGEPVAQLRRRATQGEKHQVLALLRGGLRAIRALPARNHEADFLEWEAMFERADLTPKEVRLLAHMARKMMERAGTELGADGEDRASEEGPTAIWTETQEPFGDIVTTPRGFSIPVLKWRELLFLGSLRPDRNFFVRDPGRPLPPFCIEDLFPVGVRFEIVSQGQGRIELGRAA